MTEIESLHPGSPRLGSACVLADANSICPHAAPYDRRQGPEQQEPYDIISRAKAERTARFWENVFQKGMRCQLTGTYCSEYDLVEWKKCPVLKRFNASPGNVSIESSTNPCTDNVNGVAFVDCAEPKTSVLVTLMRLLMFSRWSEGHQNREQSVERR